MSYLGRGIGNRERSLVFEEEKWNRMFKRIVLNPKPSRREKLFSPKKISRKINDARPFFKNCIGSLPILY